MNFSQTPEFQKDVKRLSKKVKTLAGDLAAAERYIAPLYQKLAPDVDVAEYRCSFFAGKRAAILPGSTDGVEIIKLRLDTNTPQYRQKLRMVCVAIVDDDSVTFIELYVKNDKSREDASRISRYTSSTNP